MEQIGAENGRALKAADAKALIQPEHMPVNLLGGYHPMYRSLKTGPEKTLEEIRNLLFREPATLHCPSLQQGRNSNPPRRKNSVAGHLQYRLGPFKVALVPVAGEQSVGPKFW